MENSVTKCLHYLSFFLTAVKVMVTTHASASGGLPRSMCASEHCRAMAIPQELCVQVVI